MNESPFYLKLSTLPEGSYDVWYQGLCYLLIKQTLLEGKVLKLFARELGGRDIVSGNYYRTN